MPQQIVPGGPEIGVSAARSVENSDKHGPQRQPKPETCVAYANFDLETAREANRTPAERESLLEEARRAYRQALKIDPHRRDAYLGLARTYKELGDREHEMETYRNARKVFPQEAVFCFEMGMSQARAREWQASLESLKMAVTLDPEDRLYTNMYGHALARAGRYDESLAWFTKYSGAAQAHYNVARMLHHLKDDERAREHLRLALKAQPDLAPAQQLLAQLDGGHTAIAASATKPAEKTAVKPANAPGPGWTSSGTTPSRLGDLVPMPD